MPRVGRYYPGKSGLSYDSAGVLYGARSAAGQGGDSERNGLSRGQRENCNSPAGWVVDEIHALHNAHLVKRPAPPDATLLTLL